MDRRVPPGAWDTHFHIFEPDSFPYASDRHFTPAPATLEEFERFKTSLGVEYVCVTHGLSYGSDCTSLLHYLHYFQGGASGICVLDVETTTDDLLDTYHAAGVRSARLDFFKHEAMHDLDRQVALIESTAARLTRWGKSRRWSIQIQQPHLESWGRLRRLASTLAFPLVVDHLGLVPGKSIQRGGATPGNESEGFAELLGALRDGNLWIKLSAPYRCSDLKHTYDDLEGHVRSMTEANPERVLWGSDWPHTQRHSNRIGQDSGAVEYFQEVDNKAWIGSLGRWLSEDQWQRMWVSNPQQLYRS
ncbi:MAG: hypothetical protein ALECFALPRED_004552 [Alectoria fallacina]|uniref:Amidohydrolase-related domain-containing protein n=1 Tax=Alectoria fallacina TaxID=1903189 RepID=A0A8H3ISM8_9LECA|nr:MAG: hypothetical protein ALECFALPRED_004552 [Alectoria fallacina]